jgi:hypothetical protein
MLDARLSPPRRALQLVQVHATLALCGDGVQREARRTPLRQKRDILTEALGMTARWRGSPTGRLP